MPHKTENRFDVKENRIPRGSTDPAEPSAEIDFTLFDRISGIRIIRGDDIELWTSCSALRRSGLAPSQVAKWGYERLLKEDLSSPGYGVTVFTGLFRQISPQDAAFLHSEFDLHPLIDGAYVGEC